MSPPHLTQLISHNPIHPPQLAQCNAVNSFNPSQTIRVVHLPPTSSRSVHLTERTALKSQLLRLTKLKSNKLKSTHLISHNYLTQVNSFNSSAPSTLITPFNSHNSRCSIHLTAPPSKAAPSTRGVAARAVESIQDTFHVIMRTHLIFPSHTLHSYISLHAPHLMHASLCTAFRNVQCHMWGYEVIRFL